MMRVYQHALRTTAYARALRKAKAFAAAREWLDALDAWVSKLPEGDARTSLALWVGYLNTQSPVGLVEEAVAWLRNAVCSDSAMAEFGSILRAGDLGLEEDEEEGLGGEDFDPTALHDMALSYGPRPEVV